AGAGGRCPRGAGCSLRGAGVAGALVPGGGCVGGGRGSAGVAGGGGARSGGGALLLPADGRRGNLRGGGGGGRGGGGAAGGGKRAARAQPVCAILLVPLALLSFFRTADWKDDLTLNLANWESAPVGERDADLKLAGVLLLLADREHRAGRAEQEKAYSERAGA